MGLFLVRGGPQPDVNSFKVFVHRQAWSRRSGNAFTWMSFFFTCEIKFTHLLPNPSLKSFVLTWLIGLPFWFSGMGSPLAEPIRQFAQA